MKKIVHIGGWMGNHLLKLFTAVADSMKNGYEIEAVVLTCSPDRLTELLELRVPIISRPEVRTSDVMHNVEENVHMLFKYRSRLFEEGWIKLKRLEDFVDADVCMHLRGGDRKAAPIQWYCNKAKDVSGRIHICIGAPRSLEEEYKNKFMAGLADMKVQKDIVFTNQSVVKDWYTILGADTVYCSASTFALSTLLFDLNKKMIVCSRESSTPDYRIGGSKLVEWVFIEAAMNYCPNLCFED